MFWYCHHLYHLQPATTLCRIVSDSEVSFETAFHSLSNVFLFRIPTILNCFHEGTFYFAPDHQWLGDFLGRYFVILNSSINFIIYCLVGSQFRKVENKTFLKIQFILYFLTGFDDGNCSDQAFNYTSTRESSVRKKENKHK